MRRFPTRGERGAALPETALVLTLMLTLIVGAMRVALGGYEQVSADGAAFYHAHQAGLKGTYPATAQQLDPDAATHAAFPRSNSSTITSGTYQPPDATVGTAYGFDQVDNRHGGASLIQPQQTISKVVSTTPALLVFANAGSVLTVTGVGVEPTFRETGVHGNIDGNDFNSSDSFGSANDYFSKGENTPPYFGGFHYMRFCNVPNDPTQPWNACPTSVSYLALGLAEFLDQDNWGRAPNGIAPLNQAVFWETLYHQRTYASLTNDLPADITSTESLAKAQAVLNRSTGPAVCNVYAWDSAQQGGYPNADYTPGAYPLTPGGSCGS